MAMRVVVVLLAAAAAVSLFAAGALAQTTEPPSCALKLVACAAYMNGTDAETPPDTCCGPLRDAVQNERTCLCALYGAPAIFRAYRINVTDALRLPKRCGISDDVSSCPKFHEDLIRLTGTSEEIRKVARAYRVHYMKTEEEGSDYLVDHFIVMH
ncbi:hypothetical protein ACQ4PT_036526 [Festuca glaucescens]